MKRIKLVSRIDNEEDLKREMGIHDDIFQRSQIGGELVDEDDDHSGSGGGGGGGGDGGDDGVDDETNKTSSRLTINYVNGDPTFFKFLKKRFRKSNLKDKIRLKNVTVESKHYHLIEGKPYNVTYDRAKYAAEYLDVPTPILVEENFMKIRAMDDI